MRNKKISADISKEASFMLNEYCIKHERSKGYLLEKMIKRYCAEIEVTLPVVKAPKEKPKRVTFKAPTVDEVLSYCNERCNNVDAQNFVDHYSVNNWMRGKNKIKDWKACVRTWEKNTKSNKPGKTSGNKSEFEAFLNE